ncbi:MAG: tRNA lysidine(34) synthetase TilS [Bdellovibrionales bacterium]
MKSWTGLHHHVWRHLKKIPGGLVSGTSPEARPLLLCVSGGADSIALFQVFKDLPVKFEIFHAHHGPSPNQDLLAYRDQAATGVQTLAKQAGVPFHFVKSSERLTSEKSLRDFRWAFLKSWHLKNPRGLIVTAHHSEDLLETRILRLIRGTGPQGLVAMPVWKSPFFRPFLDVSCEELRTFLNEIGASWCEDPSNQDPAYLRNWLRGTWLPQLERRRPGSLKRWAQTLESLASQVRPERLRHELRIAEYRSLSEPQQLAALANLLKSQGVLDFSLGQLREVQKRLDSPQRHLTFKMAKAQWSVNAERIAVSRLLSPSKT